MAVIPQLISSGRREACETGVTVACLFYTQEVSVRLTGFVPPNMNCRKCGRLAKKGKDACTRHGLSPEETCKKKVAYSEESVVLHLRQVTDYRKQAYKCPFCPDWHVRTVRPRN